ncbi:hypothetical protein Bbelb_186030 [Branchiostoma belcheri]|nr:hypothetical protein Bbelb_186030 [Branchiostoma belcheri]
MACFSENVCGCGKFPESGTGPVPNMDMAIDYDAANPHTGTPESLSGPGQHEQTGRDTGQGRARQTGQPPGVIHRVLGPTGKLPSTQDTVKIWPDFIREGRREARDTMSQFRAR